MVVRCTSKLLDLLGRRAIRLVEAPPSDDDWYANLLWLDRRKCLLATHAGTLFSLFVADIRAADLRARSSAASPNSSRLRCSMTVCRATRSAASHLTKSS